PPLERAPPICIVDCERGRPRLSAYARENGHANPKAHEVWLTRKVGLWVSNLREKYRKGRNPQPDFPREPHFVCLGVCVAILSGIGRQAGQSSFEVNSASAHGWSIACDRCLAPMFRQGREWQKRLNDGIAPGLE